MRIEEARFIETVLGRLETSDISPAINLGSSTASFRESVKPHIHRHVFHPLLKRGVRIVHSDLKTDQGVDIAGDIFAEDTHRRLRLVQSRMVMCCNMFEHIEDRAALARAIDKLLIKDGYLLISVPFSYPLHFDPIDTNFRPSPEQLCQLFPDYELRQGAVVASTTYLQDVLRSFPARGEFFKLMKRAITFFYPFYQPGEWRRRHHRLFWLFRRYQVTVVVLRKTV